MSEDIVFVRSLDASEIVSTLPDGSHPQGPLKLDINLLSKGFPLWPRLFDDGREPKRKQVLFLPPDADHRANCFCREQWPGECRRCSTVVRTFVTDETAAKLKSVKRKRELI